MKTAENWVGVGQLILLYIHYRMLFWSIEKGHI